MKTIPNDLIKAYFKAHCLVLRAYGADKEDAPVAAAILAEAFEKGRVPYELEDDRNAERAFVIFKGMVLECLPDRVHDDLLIKSLPV